jgi:hypothetical protein
LRTVLVLIGAANAKLASKQTGMPACVSIDQLGFIRRTAFVMNESDGSPA